MLERKIVKIAASVICTTLLLQQVWSQEQERRFQFTEPHLGTLVTVTCYNTDSTAMARMADSAFALMENLNLVYSDYDEQSEVVTLNRARHRGNVQISTDLARLLIIAERMTAETRGAFDPYLGRITHLWKSAFRKNRWPGKRRIRRALRRSGIEKLSLAEQGDMLAYRRKGIEIDLGGIGKGYIGDRVAQFLDEQGLTRYLIDLGGDLIAGDPPPDADGWRVALPVGDPILLVRSAVATSGTTYQYLVHQGRTYSHLIDPATGYGLGGKVTSTVVASSGAEADALASALPFLSDDLRQLIFNVDKRAYQINKADGRMQMSEDMPTILIAN